jgi:2-phosphoglycerate kinase
MTRDKTPHITISDREPGLPYSKGLMASQFMVTGLPAHRAYEVAEAIEEQLLDRGRSSIDSTELSSFALEVLGELAGERYAKNFARWQEVQRLDVPLVILIGGAVGVGKSTIATHLAHRLGIVRVVATDGSIREVMRAMLSSELMPALHVSSFETDEALREPTRRSDALVAGFREQTQAVSVGIDAMIERSVTEGTSIVIEGVHVVPGFFDVERNAERLVAVPLILEVDDESRHLNHFAVRETGVRPAERYARNFDNIRRLQRYIKTQALSHGVPIVPNHSFDQALSTVLDLVMERATSWAATHGTTEAARSIAGRREGSHEGPELAPTDGQTEGPREGQREGQREGMTA